MNQPGETIEGKYQKSADELGLKNEGKYLYELIVKYHKYFSSQDKKYHKRALFLRIAVLLFAMINTIILGLRIPCVNIQLNFGLILSSIITFLTAVISYFNIEEYWMRNISIHIELNVIRDNFVFDVEAGKLNDNMIECYKKKLDDIQYKNINYWKKAIKR